MLSFVQKNPLEQVTPTTSTRNLALFTASDCVACHRAATSDKQHHKVRSTHLLFTRSLPRTSWVLLNSGITVSRETTASLSAEYSQHYIANQKLRIFR